MIKRDYYNNGRLWYEHRYHEGRQHGVQKGWHENGQLYYEILRYQGQRHGISKVWYKDGQIDYEKHFLYGDQVTEEEYRKHELIKKLSGLW